MDSVKLIQLYAQAQAAQKLVSPETLALVQSREFQQLAQQVFTLEKTQSLVFSQAHRFSLLNQLVGKIGDIEKILDGLKTTESIIQNLQKQGLDRSPYIDLPLHQLIKALKGKDASLYKEILDQSFFSDSKDMIELSHEDKDSKISVKDALGVIRDALEIISLISALHSASLPDPLDAFMEQRVKPYIEQRLEENEDKKSSPDASKVEIPELIVCKKHAVTDVG